jgi:hypothetical protein
MRQLGQRVPPLTGIGIVTIPRRWGDIDYNTRLFVYRGGAISVLRERADTGAPSAADQLMELL